MSQYGTILGMNILQQEKTRCEKIIENIRSIQLSTKVEKTENTHWLLFAEHSRHLELGGF